MTVPETNGYKELRVCAHFESFNLLMALLLVWGGVYITVSVLFMSVTCKLKTGWAHRGGGSYVGVALVERAVEACSSWRSGPRFDSRSLPSCMTSGAQKTSSSFSHKRWSGRCLQAQRLEDSSFYVNTAFNHMLIKNNHHTHKKKIQVI